MKRFIGLFVLFFMLGTCFATAATLVQHSLDKKVFLSGVDTPKANIVTIATFQPDVVGLVRCPSGQESYNNYTKKIENHYSYNQLSKTAEVQNEDVVWLTNMKSK